MGEYEGALVGASVVSVVSVGAGCDPPPVGVVFLEGAEEGHRDGCDDGCSEG